MSVWDSFRSHPRVLPGLGVIALFGVLVWCGAASAGSPPPSAGVQQYVETLPGASGVQHRAPKPTPREPPAASASSVQQYIETVPSAAGSAAGSRAATAGGGSHGSAGLVEKIQTSPALGAPEAHLSGGTRPRVANDSVLHAAVNAVASGDNSHVLGLVLAMVVLAGLLVTGRVVSQSRFASRRGDD